MTQVADHIGGYARARKDAARLGVDTAIGVSV
jgi:hypothetical protein